MAAASLRRAGLLLPEWRLDGGRRLAQRDGAVCTGGTGIGWPVGTRDSAIPVILASIAERVEMDSMVVIDGDR